MNPLDITNWKFGDLLAIRKSPRPEGATRGSYWLCRCVCGGEVTVYLGNLRQGHTRSCGCTKNSRISAANRTHGFTPVRGGGQEHHPFYATWQGIKQRCLNLNHSAYPDYGGRGVQLTPEWVHDFPSFVNWLIENLGERPEDHSLDRIDNDGNYEPGNLRWATRNQQARNRRNDHMDQIKR